MFMLLLRMYFRHTMGVCLQDFALDLKRLGFS